MRIPGAIGQLQDPKGNSISIQGRIVHEYTGDEAEADIDSLAKKYLGKDEYPWRQPGEKRVTFVIEPTHVHHQDT